MFATIMLIAAAVVGAGPEYSWKTSADALSLESSGRTVWRFTFSKDRKPCVHPLTVPGAPVLTDFRPADHPWHRALWFSWKNIDGLPYWDEDPRTGASPGLTEVVGSKVEPRDDGSARVELDLSYHPPDRPVVLTERRTVDFSRPEADGGYRIDWRAVFTAGAADVLLDRTPITGEPGGVGHGGYAGLSLRLNPALKTSGWEFVDRDGPVKALWKASRWMAYTGPTGNGRAASLVVLDHPSSFRHPTPWYLIPDMPYFSPAVLYRAPHTIAAGKSLSLRYRILVQPAAVDRDRVEAQWQAFAREP